MKPRIKRDKRITISTHERGKESFRAAANEAGMSMSEFGRYLLNLGHREHRKTVAGILETRTNIVQIGVAQ